MTRPIRRARLRRSSSSGFSLDGEFRVDHAFAGPVRKRPLFVLLRVEPVKPGLEVLGYVMGMFGFAPVDPWVQPLHAPLLVAHHGCVDLGVQLWNAVNRASGIFDQL